MVVIRHPQLVPPLPAQPLRPLPGSFPPVPWCWQPHAAARLSLSSEWPCFLEADELLDNIRSVSQLLPHLLSGTLVWK